MSKRYKKGSLDSLPVFNRFPRADKEHEHVNIIEEVLLTTKPIIHTNPEYRQQIHCGVIGINSDKTQIYFSTNAMVFRDRKVPYPSSIKSIEIEQLESYLILDEIAYRNLNFE